MVQIFGWFSAEAARASRRNRSSAVGSFATSPGRNFSATCRSRLTSSALKTTPIPPPPNFSIMRKWEIVCPESGEESGIGANLMLRPTPSQRASDGRGAPPRRTTLERFYRDETCFNKQLILERRVARLAEFDGAAKNGEKQTKR